MDLIKFVKEFFSIVCGACLLFSMGVFCLVAFFSPFLIALYVDSLVDNDFAVLATIILAYCSFYVVARKSKLVDF